MITRPKTKKKTTQKQKKALKNACDKAQSLKNSAAPMEDKTKKILEKIKKYYDEIEKQITPKALEETSDKIRSWIARHAPEREVVKTKDFSLFNANRQPAEISETVSRIRKQTQEQMAILKQHQSELKAKNLKGRVKVPYSVQ